MAASPSLDDDLALAHRLADLATEVAVPFFVRGVDTIVKDDWKKIFDDSELDGNIARMLHLDSVGKTA